MKAQPTPIVLAKTCTRCGEEVLISGTLVLSGEVLTFRSDDQGTEAAWEHQDLHDNP